MTSHTIYFSYKENKTGAFLSREGNSKVSISSTEPAALKAAVKHEIKQLETLFGKIIIQNVRLETVTERSLNGILRE
jgi:hypothetical protein